MNVPMGTRILEEHLYYGHDDRVTVTVGRPPDGHTARGPAAVWLSGNLGRDTVLIDSGLREMQARICGRRVFEAIASRTDP